MALVDGQVRLILERRELGPARIEDLQIDYPGTGSVPGGGVRRRRGRLRRARLFVHASSLEQGLDDLGTDLPGGIDRLGITLEKGRIAIAGRAAEGGRQADFRARLLLAPGSGRLVRVTVEDVRIQGMPPMPVGRIAAAALAVFRYRGAVISGSNGAPEGAVEIDVLQPALDEVLVAGGFRLPETAGSRLASVAVGVDGISLTWSSDPGDAIAVDASIPAPAVAPPPNQGIPELRRKVEKAAPGTSRAEAAHALAVACERAGDEAGAVGALQICVENAPAGPMIGPAWRRLVELHARRGDPHAAARALIASADDRRVEATDAERAATLLAAAEILRKRLGLRDDASMLLERASALDPGSAEVLEALEALTTDAGDHQRLADVLEKKIEVVARGPREKKELLLRLADIYDGPLARPDRARQTHQRALEIDPDFPVSRVWLARDAWVRGDAPAALAYVRPVPLSALPEEGLVLRADLGERERRLDDALPALEELHARARAAGQTFAAQELESRIILLRQPGLDPELTTEELERRLASDPGDERAAAELTGRYVAIENPAERIEALSSLLRRALGLSEERRKSIYAALGQSAEAGGDLERAEQAYWRAASIEAEPTLRANYLVAHARMLLARGEVKMAFTQLDEALVRAPGHPGAAALLADLSYRTHDFPRARALYATLETTPGALDVIPRELLVQRRAALAQRAGDAAEAEALYRELAILNPGHVEARRALAELARTRGDLPGAIQRLEETIRLLPVEAVGELADGRQRLGALYLQTGDPVSARHHLELVVAQEPARVATLELLLEAYEKLDVPSAAAEICGRLARLYVEPIRRAGALYKQAELLRTRLDDPAGALDAYLRSSDLDPTFVPARLRLVDHYWERGDLEVVADLANDLAAVPLSPEDDAELVARLAISSAHPRGGGPSRFPFAEHSALAPAAVRALVEAAALSEGKAVDALDPFLTRARAWSGPTGQATIVRLLVETVLADPTRSAPALALGRFAEIAKRPALAGAAYGLVAYLAPHSPAARHLETLPGPGTVKKEALRVGGPIDHPDLAVPARRALARLASAMLGFATESPAPKPTEGSGLPPNRAAELRRIADLLGAPPFVVVRDDTVASGDDRRRLRVVPTHPAGLLIGPAAIALGDRAWSFVAGRSLETLRSGLRTTGLAGVEGVARLLEGARAALARTEVDEPQARAIADWLRRPEALLSLGSDEARAATLIEVEAALSFLPDWPAFIRGAQHTRNRIGLLACGAPNEALAILRKEERENPTASSRDGRAEFLGHPTARELLRFMFSAEYEQSFEPSVVKTPA